MLWLTGCDLIRRYQWLVLAGLIAAVSRVPAQVQPLQILTDTLPQGSVGVPYQQQLMVTGGTCAGMGTPSSTIDDGALPAGLAVTSPPLTEKWVIVGTPAAAGSF